MLSYEGVGLMFAMMGIQPTSLKPLVKPFVVGMGSDLIPFVSSLNRPNLFTSPQLLKNFDLGNLINIETIRVEIDRLMTTKLQELTPEIVKDVSIYAIPTRA